MSDLTLKDRLRLNAHGGLCWECRAKDREIERLEGQLEIIATMSVGGTYRASHAILKRAQEIAFDAIDEEPAKEEGESDDA